MKHHLPNLGNNAATYEAAILDILQKHPQSFSGVSITIHQAGKAGGAYTAREAWPPGSKSAADIAKLVAHKIVGEYKSQPGASLRASHSIFSALREPRRPLRAAWQGVTLA